MLRVIIVVVFPLSKNLESEKLWIEVAADLSEMKQ